MDTFENLDIKCLSINLRNLNKSIKPVQSFDGDWPVFFKPLFEAKLTSIKQFLKEDNTFLSLDELIRKVNINIPFTLYYGLVAAIPTEWKNILNQNNSRLIKRASWRPSVDPCRLLYTTNQQRKSTNIREQNSKLRRVSPKKASTRCTRRLS